MAMLLQSRMYKASTGNLSHSNASLLSVKHDHDQSKLDLSHAKGNLINHDDDDPVPVAEMK